ncbi:MAG TPA: enoyl-CoA hydratase/isomerase family protein [Gemmatimonadales bacterium]|nr:enoyl-CoA hydratase/isomerase family protein [Gemmatimonadales bacterium]
MTERVAVTLVDGVLTGTLNRPEKKNAIDSRMMDELAVLFERAELEAAVRVVVLRGAGKDFCAGMDLTELLESADRTVEQNRAAALRFGGVFLQMRSLPKPVIAVVQGRALAGGCGLATACDLVLAAESAQFGYPEVQRGFVPALVMNMLRRAVGEKIAFDLSATGRLVTAREAERAGLVSRVLPDAEFETGVEQIVRGIAALSPTALALTKQQLYRLDGVGFEDGIRLSADVNAVSRTTPDFRSAIAGFLKK